MYIVYILQNPRGDLYKGLTNNVYRRLGEHNSNKCPGTRGRGPWKIVYTEEYETRADARNREKFFKTGVGREMLVSIISRKGSLDP